jgi:hypothetical protein
MAEYNMLPLVVQAIKFAKSIWGMTKSTETVTPTQDAEVAKASMELLNSTATGQLILDKVAALPEDEAHKLWEEMLTHGTAAQLPVETPTEKK